MALIDLTGQKFGKLTVLYRDTDTEKLKKDRHAMWKCQCECGNFTTVIGKDLRTLKTQSCGCLQKERTSKANSKDLTGKRYGKLIVLNQEQSKNHRTYWKCLCDCGNIVIKCARDLANGDTFSCGCIYSKGEAKILQILNTLQVEFKQQYSFSDFTTIENIPYRFDFAVLKDEKVQCLIEYDGIQHFFATNQGWNTEQSLKRNQYIDKLKDKYAKENNIPLIRIPYTDFDKIDIDYINERINNLCTVDILQK